MIAHRRRRVRRLSSDAVLELCFVIEDTGRTGRYSVPLSTATHAYDRSPKRILVADAGRYLSETERQEVEAWAKDQIAKRDADNRADPRAENESTADTCEVIAAYVGDATP